MGHEAVGTIVEVGKKFKGFSIGDRVAILLRMPCGQCHWCRRGRRHICPTRFDVRGGFSEYVAAKEGMLARIPDNLAFRQTASL
jgi:D-arabinose 1-dehydrogenase-like Zn-dependent alcohol dehydrogenase